MPTADLAMQRARKVLTVAELLRWHNLGWVESPPDSPAVAPLYFCICGGLEDAPYTRALKHQAEKIVDALAVMQS